MTPDDLQRLREAATQTRPLGGNELFAFLRDADYYDALLRELAPLLTDLWRAAEAVSEAVGRLEEWDVVNRHLGAQVRSLAALRAVQQPNKET